MQITQIICDVCSSVEHQPQPSLAVDTIVIQVGTRKVEVDLCDLHKKDMNQEFQVYFTIGRPPVKRSEIPPLKQEKPKRKYSTRRGTYPCRHEGCDRVFDTAVGESLHRRQVHEGMVVGGVQYVDGKRVRVDG